MSAPVLTELDIAKIDGAVEWMNSMAEAGASTADVEGLMLADVGLVPGDLDRWAARQLPTFAAACFPKYASPRDAFTVAVISAMSTGALIALKAVQDLQEADGG